MAALKRASPNTWQGVLNSYKVYVGRSGGGWCCWVIHPKGYTLAVRESVTFGGTATMAREWVEANPRAEKVAAEVG